MKSNIKELRKKRKLRQDKLAEDVGVGVSTLRSWESDGKGFDSIVKIIKLCRALNCSVEDLADIFP